MKRAKFSGWLTLLPAALLASCGSDNKAASTTDAAVSLRGVITSEYAVPVANATVTLPGHTATGLTDANGTFSVSVAGDKAGVSIPVLVTHPDYSRLSSRVVLSSGTTEANYALRAHDLQQTITLPTSDADTVTVGTTRGDAGTSLVIKVGDLALPDGTTATGQANVKLTYWHPDQSLATAPAPLQGRLTDAGSAQEIITYGMTNVEIEQGNQLLQVANGHKLTLNFNQSDLKSEALTGMDPNDAQSPALWYADEATGEWIRAGSLQDGAVAVDANDKVISAQLPHLSAWNIDGIRTNNLCVKGKVIDACGNPEANAKLTLWVMASGQIAQFTINTAADGSYCSNLIGSTTASAAPKVEFYAWVSDYQDPNSAACNPTGKKTFAELCDINRGAECTGRDEYAQVTSSWATRPAKYEAQAAACGIPKVSAPLCGYCTSGTQEYSGNGVCMSYVDGKQGKLGPMKADACGQVPDLKVSWCGTPPSADICGTANAKKQGDPCESSAECCPHDELICSDFKCVPIKDPT